MENRIGKGLHLFKEGKIRKVGKNHYEVIGTRKYIVKKISGYWSCTCEEHFYRLEDCKHIEGCKEYERNEHNGREIPKFFNNKFRNLKMKERAINEQIRKILMQNKEHCRKYGAMSNGLRKKHHRLDNKLVEVREEIKELQPKRTVIFG